MADGRDLEQMVDDVETNIEYLNYIRLRVESLMGSTSTSSVLNNAYKILNSSRQDYSAGILIDKFIEYIRNLPGISHLPMSEAGSMNSFNFFINEVDTFLRTNSKGEHVSVKSLKVLTDVLAVFNLELSLSEF